MPAYKCGVCGAGFIMGSANRLSCLGALRPNLSERYSTNSGHRLITCPRAVLKVADLPACIAALTNAGVTFRNEMEVGPGGKQIQIEDPDGNPVELFEPAR